MKRFDSHFFMNKKEHIIYQRYTSVFVYTIECAGHFYVLLKGKLITFLFVSFHKHRVWRAGE